MKRVFCFNKICFDCNLLTSFQGLWINDRLTLGLNLDSLNFINIHVQLGKHYQFSLRFRERERERKRRLNTIETKDSLMFFFLQKIKQSKCTTLAIFTVALFLIGKNSERYDARAHLNHTLRNWSWAIFVDIVSLTVAYALLRSMVLVH